MPVDWNPKQERQVAGILEKYYPQSGLCEQAAREILPIAHQVDLSSRAIRIKPAGRAPFLAPKISLNGRWWRHHVTTEVTEHYVDALTGAPGTPVARYFTEHFQHDEPGIHVVQVVEL